MDIIRDNSWNTLLQISNKLSDNLPSYVKQYTPLTKESASNLEDTLFADTWNRQFPIDSSGSTWTSAMYLNYNKDELVRGYKQAGFDFIQDKIMKAAEVFNIKDDITEALKVLTSSEKQAAAEVADDFPIYDAVGVKKASTFFAQQSHKYPESWRKDIANTIIKKAAVFAVPMTELHRTVLVEAGYGIPDLTKLSAAISYRTRLAKDADNVKLLNNLDAIITGVDIGSMPNILNKIATVMAEFDMAEGLDNTYNKKLMTPAHTVFGINIKDAEAILDDAVKLDRHTFSAIKLAAAFKPAELDNILGDTFSSAIVEGDKIIPTKLATAFRKLPDEDRATLEEYIVNAFA